MIEQGIVVKIVDSVATISIQKGMNCDGCDICSLFSSGSDCLLPAKAPPGLSEGDRVEIEITPQKVITNSFLIFIMPILFLFAGYFIGVNLNDSYAFFSNSETFGILLGVVFFLVWLGFIKVYDGYVKQKENYEITIISIIDSAS